MPDEIIGKNLNILISNLIHIMNLELNLIAMITDIINRK